MMNDETKNQSRGGPVSGSLFYFSHWGAMGAYDPFINVYLLTIGFSGQQIGWLATLFPIATFAFGPVASALADHFRLRTSVMRAGMLIMIVCLGLITSLPQADLLLFVLFALAFARAPVIAISDGVIARAAIVNRYNFGRVRLWGSLGFATIAIGAGWLSQHVGFRPLFLVAAAFMLPAIWVTGRFRNGPQSPQSPRTSVLKLFRDWRLLIILMANFLIGVAISFSFIYDGIYMQSLGGNELHVGLLFGLAAMAELPTMQIGDALGKRFGGQVALLLSIVLLLVAFTGYVIAVTPTTLLFFGAVRGAGFGLFLVSSVNLVDTLCPAEWAATGQSLRQACTFGLAPLIAGPLGGQLIDAATPRVIFFYGIASLVLAAMVLMMQGRRQEKLQSADLQIGPRLAGKKASRSTAQ